MARQEARRPEVPGSLGESRLQSRRRLEVPGADDGLRVVPRYSAEGKNNCSPPIVKLAIASCPASETIQSMKAWPCSAFT